MIIGRLSNQSMVYKVVLSGTGWIKVLRRSIRREMSGMLTEEITAKQRRKKLMMPTSTSTV